MLIGSPIYHEQVVVWPVVEWVHLQCFFNACYSIIDVALQTADRAHVYVRIYRVGCFCLQLLHSPVGELIIIGPHILGRFTNIFK